MTNELRVLLQKIADSPEDSVFITKAEAAVARSAHEPGVVYRKWPGEPPHCMSCDCGMTEEQKRTVPLDDYLRIHRQLIDLKYPGTAWDPNRCVVCGGNHGNLPCPQMTVTCG